MKTLFGALVMQSFLIIIIIIIINLYTAVAPFPIGSMALYIIEIEGRKDCVMNPKSI